MSINMLGRMANAEKLSIAQLQQVIQDGTLPAYIGVPLLQQKMQMQKTAQASNAPQQPPVAQQVMAQAAQETAPRMPQQMPPQGIAQGTASNGIDHLQTNLPTEHMAQGGIVAFDEGGEVVHAYNGLPENMFGNSGDFLSRINDLDASAKIAPEADNTMVPYDEAIAALKAKNSKPPMPQMEDTNGITPLDYSKSQGIRSVLDKTNPTGNGAPPPADALGDLALRLTKGSRGAGSGNGPVSWTDMTSNGAEFDALKEKERSIQDYMNEGRTLMGENKGLTERENRLKKMEQETNTMEEKSPWLALMKAGIGTMKGTSQHAFANIGAGAEEGLNDYIKSQDKIASKKDKIYDAQTNLADAKRNEDMMVFKYGKDSKQSEEAHNNTLAMHKIADKQATEKLNKEGAFNASKANAEILSADARTNMSAGVQLAIAKQDNEMKKYVADLTKADNLSTKLATAYHQAASDANAEFTALLGTKGVDPMGMGAVKSIAEATALHNQLLLKHQMANGLKPMLPPGASTGAQSSATLPALTDKTAASFFR